MYHYEKCNLGEFELDFDMTDISYNYLREFQESTDTILSEYIESVLGVSIEEFKSKDLHLKENFGIFSKGVETWYYHNNTVILYCNLDIINGSEWVKVWEGLLTNANSKTKTRQEISS